MLLSTRLTGKSGSLGERQMDDVDKVKLKNEGEFVIIVNWF